MIVVYGYDDKIGNNIRSFLGNRSDPVPTADKRNNMDAKKSFFDLDGITIISRLRKIDGEDTAVTYSATDSTFPASTPPAVPYQEFVVVPYPTNIGCAVGFVCLLVVFSGLRDGDISYQT